MGRQSSLPTLYDECKSISLSDLKKLGYLEPDNLQNGTITWSRNGEKTGSIDICINTYSDGFWLELNYKYKQNPVKYRVQLITRPSNLGKGRVWYFICPQTNKLCRKLYLISSYFLHRTAFNGCFYSKQIDSKKHRYLGCYLESDRAFQEIYGKKYFKRFYAGKATKRYKRLSEIIRRSEERSTINLNQLLMK